ncbi:MAG: carboxypeptidase regulatory-like domain-containing protein [Deltaproteobacteria bacterium]|nr:carboxypeptidase regulatory-like domain-containing protein [Deltaproteobacteria bacterium]
MSRSRPLLVTLSSLACLACVACGGQARIEPAERDASTADLGRDATTDASDDAAAPSEELSDHFPELPEGPGGEPRVRARVLTEADFARDRIDGPAATALPGDVLLENDRVRVVVEAANRAIGACPYGGNVVDIDVVRDADDPFFDPDGDSSDGVGHDELGEMSLFLALGRTFVAEGDPEIVRDGSDGGVAAVRFVGRDTANDFINLKSLLGALIPRSLDPDRELGLRIAVTYVLAPDSEEVEAHWSFLAGEQPVETTMGFLADLGSHVDAYIPGVGFGAVDLSNIVSVDLPAAPWVGGQARGQAWAIGPSDGASVAGLVVVGVGAGLFGATSLPDVIGGGGRILTLEPGRGTRIATRMAIGRDLGATGGLLTARQSAPRAMVTGRVTMGGEPVVGARIGVTDDAGDSVGELDPGDHAAGAGVTDDDGRFAIDVAPGDVHVLVGGDSLATPEPVSGTADAGESLDVGTIDVASPALLALRVLDPSGAIIPAKISLVGAKTTTEDSRVRDSDYTGTSHGIAQAAFYAPGAPAPHPSPERPLRVPPGRYRLVISRGPEWSIHEEVLTLAAGESRAIEARLARVVDTTGYVATDFHQHAQSSADSPVLNLDRVLSYLAEGAEVIASSEHDVLVDYQPIVEELGYDAYLRAVVGVESTPWDYGHFNAWPLEMDPRSPNGGAPDWGGGEGPCLAPPDLFDVFRTQGARVVQVNHARVLPGSQSFQAAFDRAGLAFDFEARTFGGVPARQVADHDDMRLPEDAPMFEPTFDAVELLNGFNRDDADADGDPEDIKSEAIFRDWMNFLSFGFLPTVVGNSDTHSWFFTPAAFPRSWVRVPDDSPGAIASGSAAREVDRTIIGRDAVRDVIASGGPFVRVSAGDDPESAVGRIVAAEGGRVRIVVEGHSPAWMGMDTIEVFANQTWESPPNRARTSP